MQLGAGLKRTIIDPIRLLQYNRRGGEGKAGNEGTREQGNKETRGVDRRDVGAEPAVS